MSSITSIVSGLGSALSLSSVLAAMVGAVIGTAVGVLPGMSPTVALAILLVPTAKLPGLSGLILLSAVFFGTQYGDSLSAILLNVPSEAPAVVLSRDGYQMTRKGRAGPALVTAAVGSFCGAIVGLIGLVLCARIFSDVVFSFGPVEITALVLFGLIAFCGISGASGARMWIAVGVGLIIPTVGLDPITGSERFTDGSIALLQGFSLVPVVLGLIGFAELLELVVGHQSTSDYARLKITRLLPDRGEWRRSAPAFARGSLTGFILGLIPGPSLSLAAFGSYRLERAVSRAGDEFGTGRIEGVAGPKAADDAAVSANIASLLTVGIPFTPVTGVLYAGFLLHGIQPGPTLIMDSPKVVGTLVGAMAIGNLILLVLNFPLIGIWVRLLRIPSNLLAGILVVLILVGSFSVRNSAFDMLVTVLAGLAGFAMKRMGIDRMVVLVALILGPTLEESFRQSLQLSGGHLSVFVDRPISLTILLLLCAFLLVRFQVAGRKRLTLQWTGRGKWHRSAEPAKAPPEQESPQASPGQPADQPTTAPTNRRTDSAGGSGPPSA
jgi:putative tricarboxylic transport membrane protein